MTDRQKWLEWRHKGIGSSDAPIIHGVSEYMTRFELGEQKLADKVVEQEENFVQRIGNQFEPIARQKLAALYNMEHGTNETFEPRALQMKDLDFMRSSLDGSTQAGDVIAEFKFQSKPYELNSTLTTGQIRHHDVLDERLPITSVNQEMRCRVKYSYWIQVQHQLLVSGAKKCIFGSFDGESLHTCEIFPDTEFMKLHLSLCVEFWNLVLAKKSQPISGDDYKEMRAKGIKGKVQKWKRLKVMLEETETQMEELRAEILAVAEQENHPRLTCDGIRIVKYPGNKGSVNWQAAFIASKSSLDPNKFRKADGKPFWKLEIERGEK